MRAFVFPGQGSQTPGMGRDLADRYPAAKAVFEEVDEALGDGLSAIMWGEDAAALTLTANAQPALMAVSVAVARVLEGEGGFRLADHAQYVAGHSLGEYSALTAAGSLSIPDAARLLRLRGTAMQEAVPVGEGAMAAILGLDLDAVRAVAEAAAMGEVCEAANDNAPGQVVISGAASAVERALPIAKEKGAKRAMPLPVSAPFHCALMAPAAARMAEALAATDITAPSPALVANVKAEAVTDPAEIRDLLVQQVTGSVRWRESVEWMAAQGVTDLVELGAGKVLGGLARRIDRSLTGSSIGGPDDIDAFLSSLA